MEQSDEDATPFWLQTTDHRRRRRQSSSPLFFNTGILIILLLAIAAASTFFIIPSFLSFTSKIFKPQSVKKSWDSINLVLVLFAVICAFLSKNDGGDNDSNETPTSYENYKFSSTPKHGGVVDDDHGRRLNPSSSGQWFYDRSPSPSDRRAYSSLRRMRSSSSYPDLRQESTWMMNGDERWRFNDDTGLFDFRSRSRRERDDEQVYFNNLKDIAVDTVHTKSPPPPSPPPPSSPPPVEEAAARAPSPPPPPPSPPPQPVKVVRRKPKRIYENVPPKEVVYSELKIKHSVPSPPPPPEPPASPPHPPPPPPPPISWPEKRDKKSKKKKGGVTKDFLISLTRKRRQRPKSVENLDDFFNLATMLPLYPPPSPPPPPPPPPPPSFYNIFSPRKNKARRKENYSIPPAPPPPPPSLEARASRRESNKPPVTIHKPPLPVKIRNVNNVEDSVESGNESPFNNSIPPPPPPPPFKMPPWKFEVHGDYVRLKSIRSGSPDLDDPLSNEASPSDGGESTAAGPLFCPSPDVNTKADNFIARFRAGLNLEKMNSVKGRSNLGLDPGPSTV